MCCWLCSTDIAWDEKIYLGSVVTNAEHLTVLLHRFGDSATMPMLCQGCGARLAACQEKASHFHETELGQSLIRTAQALLRRDCEQVAAFYALHGSENM